jgi:AraC-like DNA-binding protein
MMATIAKDHLSIRVGPIFIALLIATLVFVVGPLLPAHLAPAVTVVISAIPALFWLFCHHAFGETPKLSPLLVFLAVYTVAGPLLAIWAPDHMVADLFLHHVPSYAEYVLIGAGLWTVIEYWSTDLVSSRRRLRAVVIVLSGLTILANVVSVNFGFGSLEIQRVIVAICLFGIAQQSLTVPKGLLFGVDQKKSPRVIESEDAELHEPVDDKTLLQLERLHKLMQDGFYRTEKPTISGLSKAVSIPEYMVRSLINEHMGFRNFNDFVNEWRINDAKQQLITEPDKPIMNIALDLGYRTLSSFNRAFKEREAMTPTQFRQGQTNA